MIITYPDESTETIDDIKTDSTGGTGIPWTPEEAGIYELQTHFPNQQAPVSMGFFQSGPPSYANMLEGDSEVLEFFTPMRTEYADN